MLADKSTQNIPNFSLHGPTIFSSVDTNFITNLSVKIANGVSNSFKGTQTDAAYFVFFLTQSRAPGVDSHTFRMSSR